MIKFICAKIGPNNADFDIKNDDSYNALMLAVLHVTDDNTIAMIAKCTKDKNAITNVCCFYNVFVIVIVIYIRLKYSCYVDNRVVKLPKILQQRIIELVF